MHFSNSPIQCKSLHGNAMVLAQIMLHLTGDFWLMEVSLGRGTNVQTFAVGHLEHAPAMSLEQKPILPRPDPLAPYSTTFFPAAQGYILFHMGHMLGHMLWQSALPE